jgi:hypothetical protein
VSDDAALEATARRRRTQRRHHAVGPRDCTSPHGRPAALARSWRPSGHTVAAVITPYHDPRLGEQLDGDRRCGVALDGEADAQPAAVCRHLGEAAYWLVARVGEATTADRAGAQCGRRDVRQPDGDHTVGGRARLGGRRARRRVGPHVHPDVDRRAVGEAQQRRVVGAFGGGGVMNRVRRMNGSHHVSHSSGPAVGGVMTVSQSRLSARCGPGWIATTA